MKIVCEACQAKYSIADEKVRGKVFKIRCKKCSHVIVVRGTGEVSASSGEFAISPSSAPDLSLDAGWHIVVEGEQVGPLSEGDIRARLARGEITSDTYIWKEGLPDWVKVGTIAEFKGGESEAGGPFAGGQAAGQGQGAMEGFGDVSTQINSPRGAEVFASPSAGGGAGGGREPGVPDLFASPGTDAAAAQAGQGGYGGFGGGYGGADLPAASGESYGASARGGGGNGAAAAGPGGLTGQRHENSVLFSLSNLEALAKPSAGAALPAARGSASASGGAGPGSATTTEGSGLIDIRAMANMTLGAAAAKTDRNADLPAFSAPQFSPVAPVLLGPGVGGGTPRWAIGLAIVLGGLLVAFAVVGVGLFTRPKEPPVVQAPPAPVTPPVAVAPSGPGQVPPATPTPPATPPPAANEDLPPREASPAKPAAVAERAERGGSRSGARGGRRGSGGVARGGGDRDRDDVRSPTITPSARPAPEAAPRKPKDDIEALLEAASGGRKPSSSGGGSAPAARREEEAPAGEKAAPLGREDIVKGMNGVMPKGRECFAQYKVPGVANVKVTVAPSGRVTNGTVVGKFAGTPSGACVESALKGARFPPSAGLTFDYFVPLK